MNPLMLNPVPLTEKQSLHMGAMKGVARDLLRENGSIPAMFLIAYPGRHVDLVPYAKDNRDTALAEVRRRATSKSAESVGFIAQINYATRMASSDEPQETTDEIQSLLEKEGREAVLIRVETREGVVSMMGVIQSQGSDVPSVETWHPVHNLLGMLVNPIFPENQAN